MSGIQTNNVFHGCGRLGNEPGVQVLPNGNKVISFSIAVDRSWTDKNGEKKKKTNWIRCVAFHPLSRYIDACHVHKGTKVSIVGSIEIEKYTDNNSGEQKQSFSIWLSGFEKQSTDDKNGSQEQSQAQQPPPTYPGDEAADQDLPF